MSETPKQMIRLFYSYAHEDKAIRDEMEKYLLQLKHQYDLINWSDGEILPGKDWKLSIDSHLATADLIFLLISPDFISSDYCYEKEMQHALERHRAGTCCVIPLLLRPTFWENSPFSFLQMLPTNAIPISLWKDKDEAFQEVVKCVNTAIENLLLSRKSQAECSDKVHKSITDHSATESPDRSLALEDTELVLSLGPSTIRFKTDKLSTPKSHPGGRHPQGRHLRRA